MRRMPDRQLESMAPANRVPAFMPRGRQNPDMRQRWEAQREKLQESLQECRKMPAQAERPHSISS